VITGAVVSEEPDEPDELEPLEPLELEPLELLELEPLEPLELEPLDTVITSMLLARPAVKYMLFPDVAPYV
tara:strand:+ start:364 stop:576 length:213 start_codon:yes stop_codon:yes gene_type:complete